MGGGGAGASRRGWNSLPLLCSDVWNSLGIAMMFGIALRLQGYCLEQPDIAAMDSFETAMN